MKKKTGVMFGINYQNTSSELKGCINDVNFVAQMLTSNYGYSGIKIFTDETSVKPTKSTILNEIKSLVNQSANYEEIFVHFSGHGGQIRDTNSDEIDRLDEIIFPLDYRSAGIIKDDELLSILRNSKCEVRAIFDSCHSGSVLDLQHQVQFVKSKLMTTFQKSLITSNQKRIICLSGCVDEQVSYDSFNPVNKKAMGALTTLFYNYSRDKTSVNVMDLMSEIQKGMTSSGYPQRPIISSNKQFNSTDLFITKAKREIEEIEEVVKVDNSEIRKMTQSIINKYRR